MRRHHLKGIIFFILSVVFSCTSTSNAQVVCKEGDYRFKWLGQFFRSGAKIYACDYSLPDTIGIVNSQGNLVSHNVTWTNVSPITPGLGWTNTAKVNLLNFSGDEVSVLANFNDQDNEPHPMEILIKRTVSVKYSEYIGETDYAFDNNQIEQYPTFITDTLDGLPYKFLLNTTSDVLKLKIKPTAAFYSPWFDSDEPDLDITPARFSSKADSLSLEFNEILSADTLQTYSFGCSLSPERVDFVGDIIHKVIDFVFVWDSAGILVNPKARNVNTKIDLHKLVVNANKILGSSGLFLTIGGIYYDTIHYDYNPLNYKFDKEEQTYLNVLFHTTYSHQYTGNYLCWIVNDLGQDSLNTILGRATGVAIGYNTVSLDSHDYGSGKTLAHEIGHACFGFIHPSQYVYSKVAPDVGLNFTCCLGLPYNSNCCAYDLSNFMWYNSLANADLIRAYQFKTIQRVR